MHLEMVGGLLLPLGLWLILSAGVPAHLHRGLAAATLTAVALSIVVYAAFGFALMHADPQSLFAIPTASGQHWLLAGSSGFFLEGVSTSAEALDKFVLSLPLVLAAAILLAGVLSHRARVFGLTLMVLAVCGIALPLAGCWIWGNGWLQSLAAASGFGTSTPDLGHLATVGVIAGTAGAVWLMRLPKRPARDETSAPELPAVELPVRAVAGVLCVLAASANFAQTATTRDDAIMLAQFVNTSIVVSFAIIVAGGYAVFTTRKPEALSAARAALAAVFIASAGGAAMPMWLCVVLGAICGLLATVGYYFINETRGWPDEHAAITSVLVPSVIGLLATGLVRGGEVSTADGASLMALQVITVVVIVGLAWVTTSGVLALAARLRWELRLPVVATLSTSLAIAQDVFAPTPDSTIAESVPATIVQVDEANANSVDDMGDVQQPEGAATSTETPQARTQRQTRLANLLARLRGKPTEATPKSPRKVAYPYRPGGRPLSSRPLTAKLGETEHGTNPAASSASSPNSVG